MDEQEQLAKKLLDAGFPIARGIYHIGENGMGANADDSIPEGAREAFIMPTTDELIEALGEDFQWMSVDIVKGGTMMNPEIGEKTGWFCGNKHIAMDGEDVGLRIWGKTPTEALANLYLALRAPAK